MLFRDETYGQKHFLLDLTVLSVLGFLVILSGTTLSQFPIQSRLIDDMLINWDLKLIYDIKEKRTECKENYTEFIIDRWPGTKSGCNCLDINDTISSSYQNQIVPMQCTSKLIEGKCQEIAPLLEQPINTWQLNSICFRHTNKTYYDYIRQSVPFNEECPFGTMQCGLIDSLNNKLCLKGRRCPVNDIILAGYRVPLDFYYEEIRMRRDYYLFYTTLGFSERIPVQFKLSQGKVCIHPNENNIHQERYLLDNEPRNDNCSVNADYNKYDSRYKLVDSMSTNDIYQQNGFLDLVTGLPNYPMHKLNDITSIYSRSFIGWDIKCLNNSRTTPENLRIANNIVLTLDTFNIVIFVIIGASIIYLCLTMFLYKRKHASEGKVINWITAISFMFYLTVFGLTLYCFILLDTVDLDLFSCGDGVMWSFFRPLQEKLRFTKVFYLFIAVFAICLVAAYALMVLIAYICYQIALKTNSLSLMEKHRNKQPELETNRKRDNVPNSNFILIQKKEDIDVTPLPVKAKDETIDPDDILRIKAKEEEERRRRLEEEKRRRLELEEEEERMRRMESEQRGKRLEEEELIRRKKEEELRRKYLEEEERKKQKKKEEEEEERKKREEEEERRRRLLEERRLEEERKKKEEEDKKKREEEEEKKKKKRNKEDRWGNTSDDEDDGENRNNIIEYK